MSKSGISFYPEGSHGIKGLRIYWSNIDQYSIDEVCQKLMNSYEFHSSTLSMAAFFEDVWSPRNVEKHIFQVLTLSIQFVDMLGPVGMKWHAVSSFRKGWTTPINISTCQCLGESFRYSLGYLGWKSMLLANQELNVLHLLPDKPARNGAPKGLFSMYDMLHMFICILQIRACSSKYDLHTNGIMVYSPICYFHKTCR